VPDESTGFEPEPTYPLAEQAENQVLRERLYAAQNAVVRLENERAGKVLVDPADVKWALAAISCYMPLGMVDEEQHAVLARLRDAAGGRTDAAVGDADHAGSPGAYDAAQSLPPVPPVTPSHMGGF
jgi:hypothetical protein